jgi:hypothetical protein
MTESKENRRSERAGKSDRWVKVGFVMVAAVVGTWIYMSFQTETFMKGWPEDLNAALADANQTNRRVLAVFISDPPNAEADENAKFALGKPHNQQAIQDGKFARVKVTVNSLNSDLARRYKLTHLPTMLILDAKGNELNRREGIVGEVPFMHGFLDLAEIHGPGK